MKRIEDLLKKQELARGTPDFDARMDGLFRRPPTGPVRFIQRPIALWQAVTLSAISLTLGYWVRPAAPESRPAEPSENVRTIYVYTQEAKDMENMFGVADAPSRVLGPISASMVTVKVSHVVERDNEMGNI